MSVSLQMMVAVSGFYLPPLPPGTAVTSRADCVSKCYLTPTCSSIFFDSSTNMCHLVDSVYQDANMTAVSDNMQYLVWATDICGAGYIWERALNLCYKLYTTPKSWPEAESNCVQDGGHLITVDTVAINDLMNRLTERVGVSLWLGYNYVAQIGNWVWADNSIATNPFWSNGQPEASSAGQHCVLVYAPNVGLSSRWHDDLCHQPREFVCQITVMPEIHTC